MIRQLISMITFSLMLSSCEQINDLNKTETCCASLYVSDKTKAEFERKAYAGDEDAMSALVFYYAEMIPGPGEGLDRFVTAQGEAADKARYWAEKSIDSGNRGYLHYYISSYLDRGLDVKLSKGERRENLLKALWTWQRLPPQTGEWLHYSKGPPEITVPSKGPNRDHQTLHDIIFAMRKLEAEK